MAQPPLHSRQQPWQRFLYRHPFFHASSLSGVASSAPAPAAAATPSPPAVAAAPLPAVHYGFPSTWHSALKLQRFSAMTPRRAAPSTGPSCFPVDEKRLVDLTVPSQMLQELNRSYSRVVNSGTFLLRPALGSNCQPCYTWNRPPPPLVVAAATRAPPRTSRQNNNSNNNNNNNNSNDSYNNNGSNSSRCGGELAAATAPSSNGSTGCHCPVGKTPSTAVPRETSNSNLPEKEFKTGTARRELPHSLTSLSSKDHEETLPIHRLPRKLEGQAPDTQALSGTTRLQAYLFPFEFPSAINIGDDVPRANVLMQRVYRPAVHQAALMAPRRSQSNVETSTRRFPIWPADQHTSSDGDSPTPRRQAVQRPQPLLASSRSLPRKPTRFDVLWAVWMDSAALTIQRYWRGKQGWRRAREAAAIRAAHCRRVEAAIQIQRAVRRWQGRWRMILEATCVLVALERNAAAVRVQRYWRLWQRKVKSDVRVLAATLHRARNAAATMIQRCYRGYVERTRLDVESRRWVLEWRYDSPGRVVEVVGTFSRPQWTRRVLLSWSSSKRCYIVALPRVPGRHEFKFVVDGGYCCDGAYTVVSDGAGHYNNVAIISEAPERSPYQQIRRRLSELQAVRQRKIISSNRSYPAILAGGAAGVLLERRTSDFRENQPSVCSAEVDEDEETVQSCGGGSAGGSAGHGAGAGGMSYTSIATTPEEEDDETQRSKADFYRIYEEQLLQRESSKQVKREGSDELRRDRPNQPIENLLKEESSSSSSSSSEKLDEPQAPCVWRGKSLDTPNRAERRPSVPSGLGLDDGDTTTGLPPLASNEEFAHLLTRFEDRTPRPSLHHQSSRDDRHSTEGTPRFTSKQHQPVAAPLGSPAAARENVGDGAASPVDQRKPQPGLALPVLQTAPASVTVTRRGHRRYKRASKPSDPPPAASSPSSSSNTSSPSSSRRFKRRGVGPKTASSQQSSESPSESRAKLLKEAAVASAAAAAAADRFSAEGSETSEQLTWNDDEKKSCNTSGGHYDEVASGGAKPNEGTILKGRILPPVLRETAMDAVQFVAKPSSKEDSLLTTQQPQQQQVRATAAADTTTSTTILVTPGGVCKTATPHPTVTTTSHNTGTDGSNSSSSQNNNGSHDNNSNGTSGSKLSNDLVLAHPAAPACTTSQPPQVTDRKDFVRRLSREVVPSSVDSVVSSCPQSEPPPPRAPLPASPRYRRRGGPHPATAAQQHTEPLADSTAAPLLLRLPKELEKGGLEKSSTIAAAAAAATIAGVGFIVKPATGKADQQPLQKSMPAPAADTAPTNAGKCGGSSNSEQQRPRGTSRGGWRGGRKRRERQHGQ